MAPHAGTVALEPANRSRSASRATRAPSRRSRAAGVILEALPPAMSHGVASPATLHADPARRPPSDDEIRLRAYEIYLARGCTPGHEVEDWVQAERELRERAG